MLIFELSQRKQLNLVCTLKSERSESPLTAACCRAPTYRRGEPPVSKPVQRTDDHDSQTDWHTDIGELPELSRKLANRAAVLCGVAVVVLNPSISIWRSKIDRLGGYVAGDCAPVRRAERVKLLNPSREKFL